MKHFPIVFFALGTLLLCSCSSVSSLFSDPTEKLLAARVSYSQINSQMTKTEILGLIGPPQKRDVNGSFVWEVRASSHRYERLVLVFNSIDRVSRLERASGAMSSVSYKGGYGYERAAYTSASRSHLPESVTGSVIYPQNPIERE